MKPIQPIQIWKNGALKTASILDAIIINDNMSSSCTFYWTLKEADTIVEDQTITGENLADGNVTMSGEDYELWKGGNDYAYNYIAKQINVICLQKS
jgi:hypothetical protein